MKRSAKPGDLRLPKCPTGIIGFDEITLGGLPRGRPTLVCGGAGCGKTVFGLEFLVRGIRQYKESGVCISFEQDAASLSQDVRSLGFDLDGLIRRRQLAIDHVELDRNQIAETGDYDLEGLFIRIGAAIDSVRAKRVLIDTPEALFSSLTDQGILRSEFRRLLTWLRHKGVTAVITGERGQGTLTRHGLEEYVSDCVVLLDHQVQNTVVTRRLRILKFRGSTHGTNEYPFLIDQQGISVLPVTSLHLEHKVTNERVSTGVAALDLMLGGKGYYRGTTVLLTGGPGTGKTSMGAHFIDAACRRGEKAVFFVFEESPHQLMRNMRSIGIDLARWVNKGLLHIDATRPTTWGTEMHLVRMHNLLREIQPEAVVVDPISSLFFGAVAGDVSQMVLRVVDFLKASGTTALFTALTDQEAGASGVDISSLVDTWLQLRALEVSGERNRVLSIVKSRGMSHSNQVREFVSTPKGVDLRDVYLGLAGMLTGSARAAQEARDAEETLRSRQESEARRAKMEAELRALNARLENLARHRDAHRRAMDLQDLQNRERLSATASSRETMRKSRTTRANSNQKREKPR